jgi:hypothetical protein
MVETKGGTDKRAGEGKLEESLQHIDDALEIMESHPDALVEGEEDVQRDMHRRDREYKDSCLHSIPKPRKHVR